MKKEKERWMVTLGGMACLDPVAGMNKHGLGLATEGLEGGMLDSLDRCFFLNCIFCNDKALYIYIQHMY